MRVLLACLLGMTTACAGNVEFEEDGAEGIGGVGAELIANEFGPLTVENAGQSDSSFNRDGRTGGTVRISWAGRECEKRDCTVRMNAGGGFRDLELNRDYYFINGDYRIIEVPDLRRGKPYEFQLVAAGAEGSFDSRGGFTTSTPSYGEIVSETVRIVVSPRPYEVRILTQHSSGRPSPFNSASADESPFMYAYIDEDQNGLIGLSNVLPDRLKVGTGRAMATDQIRGARGPVFPYVVSGGRGASDYYNLHSNRLSSNQGRTANFIAFAEFTTWSPETRPQFVALHAEIDPRTGRLLSAIDLVAGDLCQVGGSNRPLCGNLPARDMVVMSRNGEPPSCPYWDPSHDARGNVVGISANCLGNVRFENPSGIVYESDVYFRFSMDVQRQ